MWRVSQTFYTIARHNFEESKMHEWDTDDVRAREEDDEDKNDA